MGKIGGYTMSSWKICPECGIEFRAASAEMCVDCRRKIGFTKPKIPKTQKKKKKRVILTPQDITIKKICKHCGKVMPRTELQKTQNSAIKFYNEKKKFCNNSCANAYNKNYRNYYIENKTGIIQL